MLLRQVLPGMLVLAAAAADTAPREIAAESARLRDLAAAKPDSGNWKQKKPELAADAAAAEAALKAGRVYLALELLGTSRHDLRGFEALDKQSLAAAGLPAFEAAARSVETAPIAPFRAGTPAAVRALAESYSGRIRSLLDGGRGFAKATGVADGLYYLGGAQAAQESAAFARSLDFASAGKLPPVRPVAAELTALQNRVLAVYKPPRSVSEHPSFIRINGTLKLAQELDGQGLRFGALYQYLEALRLFTMLEAGGEPRPLGELRSAAAGLETRLAADRRDHSLARLFLERAAARLDEAAAKDDAALRRSAQAIVEAVVPAYFAALEARVSQTRPAGRTATVTLVRWPYT